MSRRTTYWRKRNVMGKDETETAENILNHNNKYAKATVPMKPLTAARIANVLHRRKV